MALLAAKRSNKVADIQQAEIEDASASAVDSSHYMSLFIYLTYLVLPSVTTTIFCAFPSFDVNPDDIQGLPHPSNFLAAGLN